MHLLVDIGNTRIKYCQSNQGQLSSVHSIAIDELTETWFEQHWLAANSIVLANVRSENFSQVIVDWASRRSISVNLITTPQQGFGVKNGYKNYSQLGVDRWLALIATRYYYPAKNCLIIDAGTATTIDVLDKQGHHHGGWILAGIDTLVDSIVSNTANLSVDKHQPNRLAFGRSTSDNLNSAAWAATLGLINQAKKLMSDSDMNTDHIVITGGNGLALQYYLSMPSQYHEMLVFDGLHRYL